jgi:hypothetical protein
VHDGQPDQFAERFDLEGHLRPGFGRDSGQLVVARARSGGFSAPRRIERLATAEDTRDWCALREASPGPLTLAARWDRTL